MVLQQVVMGEQLLVVRRPGRLLEVGVVWQLLELWVDLVLLVQGERRRRLVVLGSWRPEPVVMAVHRPLTAAGDERARESAAATAGEELGSRPADW